ncbi:TerC family protein [Priestia megaterium]|uniref:TerC family protein n=1 Tax=Priestia megaterium TaxID=1404 RepID=UPI0030007A4B
MEAFILGLISVIFINIILSGDNAVVIALACRNLPELQRKKAVVLGSVGAIILRVLLTFVAVKLLAIPYMQVVGGALLLWIALSLLKGEDEGEVKGGNSLISAIKTIVVADLVMSLDNVVAVAGVAHGNITLIIIGLLVSIPLIVWCSQLLMKIMQKFPIIVYIGSALLAYTAGEMILKDKGLEPYLGHLTNMGHLALPVGLAVIVLVVGIFAGKQK